MNLDDGRISKRVKLCEIIKCILTIQTCNNKEEYQTVVKGFPVPAIGGLHIEMIKVASATAQTDQ